MFKRLFSVFAVCLVLMAMGCLETRAVLTGDNVPQTLAMLNRELAVFSHSVDSLNGVFARGRGMYLAKLNRIKSEADNVALMFYSQQDAFVFGQAYSAEKMREAVAQFDGMREPTKVWIAQYESNITRCEKLLKSLERLESEGLKGGALKDLRSSKASLLQALDMLRRNREVVMKDHAEFERIGVHMDSLKRDIAECYKNIHTRVFFATDRSYSEVLANFGNEWERGKQSLWYMFNSDAYAWQFEGQWAHEGNIIFWTIVITFIVSLLAFRGVYEWGHRRGYKPRMFVMSRMFALTGANLMTVLALLFIRWAVIDNPFYDSIISLIIEIGILSIVVLLSVSVRLPKRLVYLTAKNYVPALFLTMATIWFRMVLVDNIAIRLVLVPVIIVGLAMQIVYNVRNRRLTHRFDRLCNEASCLVYIAALVLAWSGRYFFSLQIIIVWTILLTGLVFLSFAFHSITRYTKARQIMSEKRGKGTTMGYRGSYLDLTLRQLVRPCLLIATLWVCLYECAHIFNIVVWMENLVTTCFIDFPDKIRVSLLRLCMIAVMAIATNYVLMMIRRTQGNGRLASARYFTNIGMVMQIATVLVWGVFAIMSLFVLEVNGMGILAILSGVMVGVGIALRDTIDCFLCGVSMMMGRVKIGDYVMCGDVRGRVVDIQYRTTQIETEDGAILSFFNNAFFDKNYRNLSRKNKHERMMLHFKLQKDADITSLRDVLIQDLLNKIPEVAHHPAPRIHFVASERFYMELLAEVWVPVSDYLRVSSLVKEVLFLSIRDHGLANMMPDVRTRIIEEKTTDPIQTPSPLPL